MSSTEISPSAASDFSIAATCCDDHGRQPLRGLVHDEELRVEEQRARDREHLLLAAGELGTAVAFAARRGAGRSA